MQLRYAVLKAAALLVMFLFSTGGWAQQPVTGYAPVNGLKMYYEIQARANLSSCCTVRS